MAHFLGQKYFSRINKWLRFKMNFYSLYFFAHLSMRPHSFVYDLISFKEYSCRKFFVNYQSSSLTDRSQLF